jgi:IS4 transposase
LWLPDHNSHKKGDAQFHGNLLFLFDHKYRIFEYEGHLSDTESAKVLLSWESKSDSSKTPFCILFTDCSLDLVRILSYYNVRWNIETGYRYFKELLGFDQYQLLSHKGNERYWFLRTIF